MCLCVCECERGASVIGHSQHHHFVCITKQFFHTEECIDTVLHNSRIPTSSAFISLLPIEAEIAWWNLKNIYHTLIECHSIRSDRIFLQISHHHLRFGDCYSQNRLRMREEGDADWKREKQICGEKGDRCTAS